MSKTQTPSRRRFFAQTGKLALASAAIAQLPIQPAAADEPKHSGKRVVPGSPSKAYSRAVQCGQFIFVAGCVGRYEKGGEQMMDKEFELQAAQTLMNLKASVEAAGSSMQNVLKCTCFLKEQQHFAKFNEVYAKFFAKDPPARSTVVVKDFVVPGALLEVDCVCCVS